MDLVKKHNIVTIQADWTDSSPEIKSWLKEKYGSVSIPLTAIYPAGPSSEPIVLRDVYTQDMLLEKLHEALSASGKGDAQASRPKQPPK